MTGALPYRYIHFYFNKTYKQIVHRRQKVVFNNFRYIYYIVICVRRYFKPIIRIHQTKYENSKILYIGYTFIVLTVNLLYYEIQMNQK